MARERHSCESIVQALQCLAARLGTKTLTTAAVQEVMSVSSISYNFGSLRKAVEAAGLACNDPGANLRNHGTVISDNELFESILDVENRTGSTATTPIAATLLSDYGNRVTEEDTDLAGPIRLPGTEAVLRC
jgi:hypothetical protein